VEIKGKYFPIQRVTLTGLLCVCSLLPLALTALASQEPMQPIMERLSADGQLELAGARVYDLPVTQEFYARDNFMPAWTNPAAVRELAAAIDQARREGMNGPDYHRDQVQRLLQGTLGLDATESDLLLTDSLVRLTYHYALGKVDPGKYVASWNFDRDLPEIDPVAWLGDAIANGGIGAGLDTLKPANPMYQYLILALAKYRLIAEYGGWNRVADGPTLGLGDRGPRVAQLRRRLQVEGDAELEASGDMDYFDAGLERAVIRFQSRYRLDADGVVGRQTLVAMNVPIERRIGQIRVNLERARVLRDIPPTAVVVDIAGFEVSLFRDGQRLLRSRAVVGRPYRCTPMFRDAITHIEINPTWTVPPTIFKKDVLPAIKQDPGYLEKKNMQVLTMAGVEVDPSTVDWRLYPREGFPYMIRQTPGPHNALGRLKVMFPNEHMVYLHDTPNQELFKRSERTFSSGCIRVEHVERLAELLLNDPQLWDLAAINATIDSRKTTRVSLRQPMPIYLVYWTVQAQANGEVQFKHDPYDRDAVILRVLDQPLVPDPARIESAAGEG
jgi:murein L,D-transpeptidase YcbB/YkuD